MDGEGTELFKIRKKNHNETILNLIFPILNSSAPLYDKAHVRDTIAPSFVSAISEVCCSPSHTQQARRILELLAEILPLLGAEGSGTHVASSEHVRIHSSIHH